MIPDVAVESILQVASSLFAEYTPRHSLARRDGLDGLLIRPSMLSDRDALAGIAWRRNGGA